MNEGTLQVIAAALKEIQAILGGLSKQIDEVGADIKDEIKTQMDRLIIGEDSGPTLEDLFDENGDGEEEVQEEEVTEGEPQEDAAPAEEPQTLEEVIAGALAIYGVALPPMVVAGIATRIEEQFGDLSNEQ